MDQIIETAEEIGVRAFGQRVWQIDWMACIRNGGIPVGILIGIMAVLMLFFGLKCKKVLFGIQGVVAGIAAGFTGAWFLNIRGIALIGIALAAGIILCVLEVLFQKFGTFLFAACAIAGTIILLVPVESFVVWITGGVAGVIVAAFAVAFLNPIVIPVMGIGGGAAGAVILTAFIDEQNKILLYLSFLILAIIGSTFQYLMEYRKIGKIEQKKVREIRENRSVESEIETARTMLETDGEPTEEKEIAGEEETSEKES